MTKRRKLYEEKCKDRKFRLMRAMDAVMRGVEPRLASSHYRIFNPRDTRNLVKLYIPKEESWLDRKRKEFWVNLNNKILNHFNDNKDK